MKKTVLLILLASTLLTSCLKDGFNDFEALKHPLVVQGTVHPTLGVPIANGSATIFDMLQMVQISEASMVVGSNGIITVVYDTAASFQIDLEGTKKGFSKRMPGAKSDTIVHVARNSIDGVVAIDLFDNIEFLDNAELEVDSLKVNLGAFISAQTRDSALEALQRFHVHVYYDQLYIDVVGKDGNIYHVVQLQDSIPIDSLIIGQYIKLFDNTDISEAINHRPVELRYGARMNIAFEAAFFGTNMSENQFVADSIGVTMVNIDADVDVQFPISAYISDLSYETDILFEPSFRLGDLVIDSSMIFIDCQNEIPLGFKIRLQFVDGSNNILCDVLSPSVVEVAGAEVALNPATNLYTSSNASETLVQIPVTKSVFDNLLKTKKIRMKAELNTSDTGNPLRKRVSIQADDKLNVRLWAKIDPMYDLNISIGGSEGNNSKKGGSL